jgi:diguanylate cyclase (GGDEF)-like protein
VRRAELQPWVHAWLANLVALLFTVIFWFGQPSRRVSFFLVVWGYFFGKTLFILLLAAGAARFAQPHGPRKSSSRLLAAVAVLTGVAALLVPSIDVVGVLQASAMAIFLGEGAIALTWKRAPGSGWLAAGFGLRAALGVVEAVAYGAQLAGTRGSDLLGIFLASHSSLDTGAEWVIALGCVLAFYRAIQRELTQANLAAVAAKDALQELVDHDPLTGLSNRRALPGVLRASYETGATIIFFDLNDFKEINDTLGHQAGDECLRRFAAALKASVRPDDRVFRFAGDEFVIVAQGAEPSQIVDRVETVRARLKIESVHGHRIEFSAGHAYLPVHGDTEAALKAADEAMYVQKTAKRRR